MIFGRVMFVGLWNLAKYLVVTTLFSLCLEILTWFLVYECIMMRYRSNLHFVPVSSQYLKSEWSRVVTTKYLAKFQSPLVVSWPKIIQPEWISKGVCNLWLYTFISLWFEILTWFLVWECIIISYRSILKFILFEWFLANLQLLGFEIWET
jgi:hypothetical protein